MKNFFFAVLTVCLVFSASVKAQEIFIPTSSEFEKQNQKKEVKQQKEKVVKKTEEKIKQQKKLNSLLVGLDLRSYNYDEPDINVKHKGLMYGGWFDFSKSTSIGVFVLKSNFTYASNLTYEGILCDSQTFTNCNPYTSNNSTELIVKTNAEYQYVVSDFFSLKAGLGYRYLSDSNSDPGFYLRTGGWGYIPLTVQFNNQISSNMNLKIELEYDYIFYGGIKSNISEADPSFEDVYHTQTGNGLNLNGWIRYNQKYSFGAFFETWTLNETEMLFQGSNGFQEPANTGQAIGLRVGYDLY